MHYLGYFSEPNPILLLGAAAPERSTLYPAGGRIKQIWRGKGNYFFLPSITFLLHNGSLQTFISSLANAHWRRRKGSGGYKKGKYNPTCAIVTGLPSAGASLPMFFHLPHPVSPLPVHSICCFIFSGDVYDGVCWWMQVLTPPKKTTNKVLGMLSIWHFVTVELSHTGQWYWATQRLIIRSLCVLIH